MDKKLESFKKLANLFESNGYHLYLVGGSVRDYLLNIPLTDMDVVTDATPEQESKFLNGGDFTFAKYGSIKHLFDDVKFDITTFRKENDYSDSRHPNEVVFTKKIEEDVLRRDITINALYMEKSGKIIDLIGGLHDLEHKIIRIIGNPDKRFKEDSLRIIRLLRFKVDLGFELEEETLKSMKSNSNLTQLLNKDKVNQEIKKCHHQSELVLLLQTFGIKD